MIHIAFPFRFDGRGQTALTDIDGHIVQLIEQVLFTRPGERVNRPDFGTGIQREVFNPNRPEVAAALSFSLHGALQRYLGHVVEVHQPAVICEDAVLSVQVPYRVRRTGEQKTGRYQWSTF